MSTMNIHTYTNMYISAYAYNMYIYIYMYEFLSGLPFFEAFRTRRFLSNQFLTVPWWPSARRLVLIRDLHLGSVKARPGGGEKSGHDDTPGDSYVPRPPNVPLLKALWSLVDGIWGVLKGILGGAGSFGVQVCQVLNQELAIHQAGWSNVKARATNQQPPASYVESRWPMILGFFESINYELLGCMLASCFGQLGFPSTLRYSSRSHKARYRVGGVGRCHERPGTSYLGTWTLGDIPTWTL